MDRGVEAGYCPQGRKELDMTEWLSTTHSTYCMLYIYIYIYIYKIIIIILDMYLPAGSGGREENGTFVKLKTRGPGSVKD